jgi:flagellar protein FliS
MYSTPFGSPAAAFRKSAGAYHQVGVQTAVACASAHQLIGLLFDAFFAAAARARCAMQHHDVAAKGAAISHAVRIVDEGLKSALDVSAGGKLAADLADLYAYVCLRLTQANLRNDLDALTECERLMQPLREAWTAIGQHRDVVARQ